MRHLKQKKWMLPWVLGKEAKPYNTVINRDGERTTGKTRWLAVDLKAEILEPGSDLNVWSIHNNHVNKQIQINYCPFQETKREKKWFQTYSIILFRLRLFKHFSPSTFECWAAGKFLSYFFLLLQTVWCVNHGDKVALGFWFKFQELIQ